MGIAENKEAILRYFYEIVNKRDQTAARQLFSPQFIDYRSRAGLPADPLELHHHIPATGTIFPDVHDDIEAIAVTDDKVAIRVLGTGTHSQELFGVPATGKFLTWTATMVWQFSANYITARWLAFDYLSQMIQLGVIPPLKHVVIPQASTGTLPLLNGQGQPLASSSEPEQLQPLLQYIAALKTGKLTPLNEVIASDYTDHGGWIDGLPTGPDALKQEVSILREAFPDLEITPQHMFAAGEYAVLHMLGTGTHQGEFFGLPATHKRATWMTVGIYRLENGKLKERWIDASRLPLLRQLEVIPPLPFEPLAPLRFLPE
ncbi:hypothetical protein EPA93_16690 [Ktedonosporobacter rubrisoli]|uniref:Ester cyclase n=1 Tax=Ktedonosporobacter rubrisoli TaxID=2509675 RepID=A0A4P6JQ62_KTERU|nr:ester cyclase family protein [Ktedonosporobacter rubrisoli]QBD77539.1 hypothetical protein EPA93_16690 [Ktedonosporobacter rubrisoli]